MLTGQERRNPCGANRLRRTTGAKTRRPHWGPAHKALQCWPCALLALVQQSLPRILPVALLQSPFLIDFDPNFTVCNMDDCACNDVHNFRANGGEIHQKVLRHEGTGREGTAKTADGGRRPEIGIRGPETGKGRFSLSGVGLRTAANRNARPRAMAGPSLAPARQCTCP
jgi:hypothetical protein